MYVCAFNVILTMNTSLMYMYMHMYIRKLIHIADCLQGSTRSQLTFDFSYLSDFSLVLPQTSSPYGQCTCTCTYMHIYMYIVHVGCTMYMCHDSVNGPCTCSGHVHASVVSCLHAIGSAVMCV